MSSRLEAGASLPPPLSPRRPKKSVSFCDQVVIREFPVMLGDNPACSEGIPVMLLWPIHDTSIESKMEALTSMETVANRRYDKAKQSKQYPHCLWQTAQQANTSGPPVRILSASERSELLLESQTTSREEMDQALEIVRRIQRQRLASFRQSTSTIRQLRQAIKALVFVNRLKLQARSVAEGEEVLPSPQDPLTRIERAKALWTRHYDSNIKAIQKTG
jgi:hypothetical protein